ncbi:GNAT family N-acetyltransferase [Halobacillus sp. BBL2006]|uniref:GNAT family N-acetyltransferase n=1 Tax=Halobacillus sp. BBL2006 TaxID=1543706 RepID=UPI0005431879|nr:GNAT family N-acetyltransferase [Halobacillus sp. BBL2006]KHE72375.1 acetyltransferase [Halobacillus sp. BBL2006]
MSVQLQPYEENYKNSIRHFYLPEDQLYFTAMPTESVDLAEGDPTRHPVTILADGKPVGMFVLQDGPRVQEYTHHKNALLLIAYMIDRSEQGKGYATHSLRKLPNYIREYFPEISHVVLAVNMKNHSAQRVYQKCGFVDKGERKLGKKGWQMILEQSFEKNV